MERQYGEFGRYITPYIDNSGKMLREIANDIGYKKHNMISLIKTGEAKLPLNKVPLLAQSLNINPINLLENYLRIEMPELHALFSTYYPELFEKANSEILPPGINNHQAQIIKNLSAVIGSDDYIMFGAVIGKEQQDGNFKVEMTLKKITN